MDAGHRVRVMTTKDHAALLARHGLEGCVADLDVQAELAADSVMESGKLIASFRRMSEIARRGAVAMIAKGLEAAEGADAILCGVTGVFVGLALAEKLRVPLVQAYNLPLTPTGAFPGVLLPWMSLRPRPFFHRLSHRLTRQIVWTTMRSAGDVARQEVLKLSSAPRLGPFDSGPLGDGLVLYGYSACSLPRGPEWGERIKVTGAWFLGAPSGFVPPPALEAFLARGPRPVYIGFGSMNSREPEATARLVFEAARLAGVRVVVSSGWSGLRASAPPESAVVVGDVPHDWLFERVAAIVHHGGAGTTAAALRAGVPSMAIPFHGDQPFWAGRSAGLGVGPAPIPRRRLSSENLAVALRALVSDDGALRRAADLGARVRSERGVEEAIEAIEALPRR